ncbi:MAG: alpha/beta fold hydrolase [Myxococcales bacterium]|nr:alpha/beta fold hydrolase [Myxococcales bacterium]
MDREKIAFTVMKPLDLALGAVVKAARESPSFEPFSDRFYGMARTVLGRVYAKNNDLQAEGLEHVPMTGGVLFAANHQSWNDVQVVGATCPRRLRFLAKTEFETWPILRHLIALSDSPFIRRGGDPQGMAQAVRALREGRALVIFPEGTIPGEEDKGRHEVEPDTGLLRGHTGAVRLAIEAQVPIVPVGVSGTGKSFPPEVYPRLELLEAPRPVPVTVRYGEPIRYDRYHGKPVGADDLRRLTKELMLAISRLVDFQRHYVPITVPIPPLPRYRKLGVLLLHGFTSSVRTVDGMAPLLREAGIPYRIPVLRGHGTRYTDLEGVTAQDWYEDAETALMELSREVDKVVVVGLSMGGLLAIHLGIRHPDQVAAVVTWGAALRFRDPLAPLSPLLARVVKSWPSPESFRDQSLKVYSENYPRFMTSAFSSLFHFARETERRLPELTVPICVLHSKRDQVIDPLSAVLIYRDVSSPHREIHWFHRSGHEMGQDCEREAVFARTMEFIGKFRA